MKTLTIRQPWAHLIASGAKPVENRLWRTSYRGRLAIHAGQRWDKGGATDYRVMLALRPFLALRQLPDPIDPAAHSDRFVFGAVIAVTRLVDCHRAVGCCAPWGDPDVGDKPTWHWVLTDVQPLREPVLARGAQGLWDVDLRGAP